MESDVYQIDTTQAQEALEKLAEEQVLLKGHMAELREESKSFADVMANEMHESLFSASAQVELFKKGLEGLHEVVSEGFELWMKEETAVSRLSLIMRNAGSDSETLVQHFEAQASQIQRTTGASKEMVFQVQELLTALGVAPEEMERFTKATFDLATLMGTDAVQASRLLGRANEEGKDTLKRYGIVVDEHKLKMEGVQAVLEEVEKKTAGVTDAIPPQVKQMNELKGAWEDFKVAVGQTVGEIVGFLNTGNFLVKALDNWSEFLTGKAMKANLDYQERIAKGTSALAAYTNAVDLLKMKQQEVDAMGKNDVGLQKAITDMHDLEEQVKQAAEAYNKLDLGNKVGQRMVVKLAPIDATETKEHLDAVKKQAEEERKIVQNNYEQMIKDRKKHNLEVFKAIDDLDHYIETQNAKEFQSWDELQKQKKEDLKKNEEDIKTLSRQASEEIVAIKKKEAAEVSRVEKQTVKEMASFLGDFAKQAEQLLVQQINDNTQFTKKMNALSEERQLQGLNELEATQKKKELDKAAKDAEIANLEDTLAKTLESIAQAAAVKATEAGAEAIYAYANDDYPKGAAMMAAAAEFAAVAAAAGGGAAIIQANRGMTADETKQYDDQVKADADQRLATQQANAHSTSVVNPGELTAQVNIYNLGITGQTDAAQGQVLSDILNTYTDLSTGSQVTKH